MSRKYYGRYPAFHVPSLSECTLNDHQIIYEANTGDAFFDQIENAWCELETYINDVLVKDNNTCQELQVIGSEILKWIKKRDTFAVSLLLKLQPDFIDTYLSDSMSIGGLSTPAASMLLNALCMKS